MDNVLFQSYIVAERSYVAFIKREIHNLVKPRFSETRTGEIDIVVSEMCSNLIKHARSGELLYRLGTEGSEPLFEVLCLDNGPGIRDIHYSSRDGISSKNTLGHGMGSIFRLSSLSQVYSLPDWGTIVYSRFYNSPEYKSPAQKTMLRCINVAKPGEKVSGDGAAFKTIKGKSFFFTGDGLGHGEHARDAVEAARQVFEQSYTADASEMIREMHANIKKTRGLVATVAILDHERMQWELCGVGNISTRLQRGLEYKSYISNNGIVGHNIPTRLENWTMAAEKFQLLILCSDGIKTRWDLMQYPSILKYDPLVIAAAIYKDNSRKTDDMTVMIVKVT